MLRPVLAFGLLVTYCFALSGSAHGEDWPGWRGPRGDGTSRETNVPLGWDGPTGKNVLWKV